jgi:hypothetical protein
MRIVQNNGGMTNLDKPDRNNCTVRSLAIAYNIPYLKAYELCKAAGREDNKGFYTNKIMNHVWKKGYKYMKVGVGRKGMTIRRFLEQNPIGIFLCTRRGHAFTVIHGEVHDTTPNTERQIVTSAYLVFRRDANGVIQI